MSYSTLSILCSNWFCTQKCAKNRSPSRCVYIQLWPVHFMKEIIINIVGHILNVVLSSMKRGHFLILIVFSLRFHLLCKPLKILPQISRISSSPKLCVSPSNLVMMMPASPFSPFCPIIDSPWNICHVTKIDYTR